MADLLALDFMRRALLAALMLGVAAPLVGVFLVQRRLSLIGDGLGHIALAGVAVGVVTGNQPVWTALATAVAAAVIIELVRARGRVGGDTALAIFFYGGIALGVVLLSKGKGGATLLNQYLFGAITTTSPTDLTVFAALSGTITLTMLVLRTRLFAVAQDEEYARASGLPVTALNLALAIFTAVTVVASMRIVGLLLISALMVVPTAAAQAVGRSFASVTALAVGVGVLASVGGVVASYALDTPSGGTIVLAALALFLIALAAGSAIRRLPST